MAYLTQLDTSTLSNQSLTTALLVHTFTNTTRVRKVWVGIDLKQIAGNGDYKAWVTIQRAGAGDAITFPRTTAAVVSGDTTCGFYSNPIVLNATDVLKVYVIGLAGDTTTPDITTYVWEEFIATDASGRVDLGAILGTALTETAGQIAAAVKKFFDVAAPTGTVNSLPDAVPAASGGLITRGTGTGQLSVSGGRADANVARWNNNALSGSDSFEVTVRSAVLLAESADFADPAYIGGAIVAAANPDAIAAAVLDATAADYNDAGTIGEKINSGGSGSNLGAGAISHTVTINDSNNSPIDGAEVWITTDLAGANIVASGTTNSHGQVTFMLDSGSYYQWVQSAAHNFSNPTAVTVSE